MAHARLILETPQSEAGSLRLAARLVESDGAAQRLWWSIPETFAELVTPAADPWVVGLLFPIMQRARPVHVEGCASRSLLANLELFMSIWQVWSCGRYRAVAITADEEAELPAVARPGSTLASFSCGVDSCFTVYRHMRGLAGRRSRPISAGVLQHGFDVWLDQANSQGIYDNMLADARTMLSSLGVPCIPLATNFHELDVEWADAWGTQLISGLTLLAARYDTALVANDLPYAWLGVTWPHHPVTTPLLGSRGMTMIDDGGECTRSEKAKVIADWPEAMRHLRVCFGLDIPGQHENCCACEKCARTMLAFRAAGCPLPAAFKHDISDEQIKAVRWNLATRTFRWTQLAQAAEAAGLGQTSWAAAIRTALRRNRWRMFRNRLQKPFLPVRSLIRRVTRGTALSRREIAAQTTRRDHGASSRL